MSSTTATGFIELFNDLEIGNESSANYNQKTSHDSTSSMNNVRKRAVGISDYSRCEINNPHVKSEKSPIIRQSLVGVMRKNEFISHFTDDQIAEMVEYMEHVQYPANSVIIEEGSHGHEVFILQDGSLTICNKHGETIREIHEPIVFGELAILYNCLRTATVLAKCDCLIWKISRSTFKTILQKSAEARNHLNFNFLTSSYKLLICDLEGFTKQYPDEFLEYSADEILRKVEKLSLKDFTVIATLGVGGFGRVELVRIAEDNGKTFALKQLKKHHIVQTRQQQHVINEKKILNEINSSFIVKLYKTFKDRKYLYFLLEACLGGELWSILRNHVYFDETTSQFYVACVIEALSYLHLRGIVYRDLKPENLLLDSLGYCKITDFGFSKKIGHGQKTWTFCGTPEYTAPEIILNRGHDFAVDYWSLGILTYELLSGSPPFTGDDHMKIYNKVLKGIDSVDFPKKIKRTQQNFIKKLCRDVPVERIGYGKTCFKDISSHDWFREFIWDDLRTHKIRPPIIPQVKSPIDTSNFDTYSQDTDTLVAEDMTGWDIEF